ncbi:hypothetical protein [Natronococcus pandeyae]|nr:hypothetical protein [Natronococcus pandeyae]
MPTVDVGTLLGVFETRWSVRTAEKTQLAIDEPERVRATRGRGRNVDHQA